MNLYAWALLAILSGALLAYLLGNGSVTLLDRDEPRYAQTSRQMLQSGDWVVPRFLDTVRTAKPVLIYWCQATAMAVFGDNAFAARFPSAVAMVGTLAVLGLCVWREAGARRGIWTAFILATSALTLGAAKMCLTDSVLLLWTIIGQCCIYRLWRQGISPLPVLMLGLSIGLSGLTKGPVSLGVHLMTIAALALLSWKKITPTAVRMDTPRPRNFMPGNVALAISVVTAVVCAVTLPWIYLIEMRAPGFLTQAIGHDVVQRIQTGHEGHSHPPGFYSLVVWATWFPWSLLLPAALVTGWKFRHLPLTRFALAAWIGPWVMFELISGKLPHYVLPTYPALAYLTADMLIRAARGTIPDLSQRPFKVFVWIGALGVAVLGSAPWVMIVIAQQYDARSMLAATCFAVISVVGAASVARYFNAGRVMSAARMMGVSAAAALVTFWAAFLPLYQPLRLSQRVADAITDAGGYAQVGYMIDYKEPSLAFHAGGGLVEQTQSDYLQTTPPDRWPIWIVLTERVWRTVPADVQTKWHVVTRERGLAYNDQTEPLTVLVIKNTHAAQ